MTGPWYLTRSDQPGARGLPSADAAVTEAHRLLRLGNVPHDASVAVLRPDMSTFRLYRYTLADDGFAGWHDVTETEA